MTNHTVAIIGQTNNVEIASRAIESLIRGSPHSSVYRFLEKSKAHLKEIDKEDVEEMIEK